MSYASLLRIELQHAYYSDGLCPDFITLPSPDTQQFLTNQRCVVKPNANGLDIVRQTDANGNPVIAFDDSDTLSFELCLRNLDFSLFTDLTKLPTGNNVGITYASQISAPVYAQVDITRNFNQVTGEQVAIAFAAKPVRWLYYLLILANDTNTYSIASNTNPAQYTWSLVTGTDPVASALALQSPGFKVASFLSDQTIPCQQSGMANIQLKVLGSPNNTVLIDSLPNPSYRNFLQTDVSTAQSVDALYHVLTFMNTPTK